MSDNHFQSCERDPCACDFKRYWQVLLIGLVILVLEIVGGLWSGSLALLSDAGHVLTDSFAIVIAMIVERQSMKKPDREREFRKLGALVHATALLLAAVWISYEAVERFSHGVEIITMVMIPVAIIGTVGNFFQHRINHQQKDNLTSHGMNLHILSDLAMSISVVVAGALIWLTDEPVIDLVTSLVIASCIVIFAIRLFIKTKKS